MKNKEIQDTTVFVGISGGVDSSVSAALLKDQGYNVVGVFIKVWHPDFLACDWEQERLDAMRVCVRLDIPFLTLDLEKEYKEHVADYLISEYKAGRTPNPDIMCNKHVKFGSFLQFAQERGANYIATGHYARIKETSGVYQLYSGVDSNKDQSYFLWTLTQEELKHTLFPVGELKKEEVRRKAKQYGLFTSQKKDSQGICFLGNIDMQEFLPHYISTVPGNVLNTEGEVVGTHTGALMYTIGQRHGFEITEKTTERTPYYIVSKDIEKNTLTVSHNPKDESFTTSQVELCSINWIDTPPVKDTKYQARYRHLGEFHDCSVEEKTVFFSEAQYGIAQGQSLVLYDKGRCVGGGIIE